MVLEIREGGHAWVAWRRDEPGRGPWLPAGPARAAGGGERRGGGGAELSGPRGEVSR